MHNYLDIKSEEGPMKLLAVTKVYRRNHRGYHVNIYEVHLAHSAILAATGFHAFIGVRGGIEILLRGDELIKGDQIWVDVSAFSADGSLGENKQITKKHPVLTKDGWKEVGKLKSGDKITTMGLDGTIKNNKIKIPTDNGQRGSLVKIIG